MKRKWPRLPGLFQATERKEVIEDFCNDVRPITKTELKLSMDKVSEDAQPWDNGSFTLVHNLPDAIKNNSRVLLMKRCEADGGHFVAVKRMPTEWVRRAPKEFKKHHPDTSENPWVDLGLIRQLNTLGYPYVCDLIGVFHDDVETYVVTSYCTGGELFGWCDSELRHGKDREAVMLPIATQFFHAVRWLHDYGIAHRDLSLENIIMSVSVNGDLQVKMIDFGMATLDQTSQMEVYGKQSYQAPEMHEKAPYNNFLVDVFALGVVLFAMAAQDYPWTTTKPSVCKFFEYVGMFGFRKFLEKRKLRKGNGEYLIEVFTPPFIEVLEGLLEMKPWMRISLGEAQLPSKDVVGRASVWDLEWFQGVTFAPAGSGATLRSGRAGD